MAFDPTDMRARSEPEDPNSRDFELAAFDLDGTVLPGGGSISDRTVAAVKLLRARGTKVVAATGRRFEGAQEHAARLGLRDEDPVICYNGAMVRRMNGETLLSHTLTKALSVEFLRWAGHHGLHARVFIDGCIAIGPETHASREYLRHPAGPGVFSVESPEGWLGEVDEEPIKLALTDTPGGVETWLEEAQTAFVGRLLMTRSHPYYVEVMSSESTKSGGLAFLCDHWDIDRERVLAFGDAENDIDMLRFAGHGVAVNPMTEQVRRAADDLALPCNEDGVARYLEDLL